MKSCHKEQFTKFIKFLLTQQLTKLSDFIRKSGEFVVYVAALI